MSADDYFDRGYDDDEDAGPEFTVLGDATVVGETEKALLFDLEGSADPLWVPRSVIDSELCDAEFGDDGELNVKTWWAVQEGLDE